MAKANRSGRDADRQGRPAGEAAPFPDEYANRPREYHGRRTMVAAVLVLGAVALALALALRGSDEPRSAGDFGIVALPAALNPEGLPVAPRIGALAPDFRLETLAGTLFRLSDSRGQPLLLNFWASWCGPCRREVPVLVRLQDRFRAQGLLVVGINIEEARGPAGGFAEEFGINYLLPMDFGGGVTRAYGVFGPPHTYLIDSDGLLVEIIRGQAPDEVLEELAAELMTAEGALVGSGGGS